MIKLEELKHEVKQSLESGKVKYFIGYKKGTHGILAAPHFVRSADDVEQLVWNPTCVQNLARFIVDEKRQQARQKQPDRKPVGIIVKGCDSRALTVLLQEKYINREDVYIIGISCEHTGVIDEKKLATVLAGQKIEKIEFSVDKKDHFLVKTDAGDKEIPAADILATRCSECKANFPVIKDLVFGDNVPPKGAQSYHSVAQTEALEAGKRWKFWKEKFDQCIRCYACRSVCPMCYCEECVVDSINYAVTAQTGAEEKAQKIKWIEKSPTTSENMIYHMVRGLHLTGRCIDCGECERVCPLDIPLRQLNKKMEKTAKELFNYDAGMAPDKPALVSCFKDEDPEDFIR